MTLATTQPVENAALLRTTDVDSLADFLRRQRTALFESLNASTGGVAFARSYSDLVDSVIRRMLGFAWEKAGNQGATETVPVAVVATGGYGRRELCPPSDIDITFIPAKDGDAVIDRMIKEMFTYVMRVFMDANGMS